MHLKVIGEVRPFLRAMPGVIQSNWFCIPAAASCWGWESSGMSTPFGLSWERLRYTCLFSLPLVEGDDDSAVLAGYLMAYCMSGDGSVPATYCRLMFTASGCLDVRLCPVHCMRGGTFMPPGSSRRCGRWGKRCSPACTNNAQ